MAKTRTRKQSRSRRFNLILKPRGAFHPRVQAVGPQHFGIVAVDCAKARSKWMLADFYGKGLIAPVTVAHNRADLDAAVAQIREAIQTHAIHDLLVAVERTGRYHHLIRRAFAAAGFEVRIVHPFATKQFRQPANPGYKTDDTDLAAIHRAAVNGFALIDEPLDPSWVELQLLTRHRRDLVHKASALCCQIREHLDAALPGYAACFKDLWESQVALHLARRIRSPEELQKAGRHSLADWLHEDRVGFRERTLHHLLAWAAAAATPDAAATTHHRIALALDDDRQQKEGEIQCLERQIAGRLASTPYVVLLSICGINVVSAAEYAAEMGPITRYANPQTITGRAGLCPSRYQSDAVDHADGPLIRCANRRLRFAIMQIADNLIACNQYFAALGARWKTAGKDPRRSRVKVGCRFARISYHMVAGQKVFRHPVACDRDYVLQKLMTFHKEHRTPIHQTLADLQAAARHLPRSEYAAEAAPLVHEFKAIQQGRRRGPQPLGEILPQVLAQLGIAPVQSTGSGEIPSPGVSGDARSRAAASGPRAENAFCAQRGKP
jgi:transposase